MSGSGSPCRRPGSYRLPYWINRGENGGGNSASFEVWQILLFSGSGSTHMDPDPNPGLNNNCMLYVLLVWWGSDCGAAVRWLSCFYIIILFRFTNKKIFSLENKPHNEKFKCYVYKSNFSKFSSLVWRHAYCGACLIPQPRFYFSQLLPMLPPHYLYRGGGLLC